MKTLVCFLEENSAREFLEEVFKRFLPNDIIPLFIVFWGKQDLEKQLIKKLQNWKKPDTVFLILRDQDSADCKKVKANLVRLCKEANRPEALVRIACHELESFYFGDLSAVEKALNLDSLLSYKHKAQYRIPDAIITPSKELAKITNYTYQKLSGSRKIGKIISLENNTSRSFNILLSGVKKLCSAEAAP